MSETSSAYGQHDRDVAGSEQSLVAVLGGLLAVIVAPSVIGPPLVLGTTAITDVNIRSWTPFDKASAAWDDISDFFTSVNANAAELAGDVQQNWRSTGADAFAGFVRKIDKQLDAIAAAAQGCRDMCDEMKWALVGNLTQFAATTVAAIIGAALALSTVEEAPAIQLELVAVWTALVLTILSGLAAFAEQLFGASKDISDAYSDLTDVFTFQAGKIQTDSLRLPALTSGRIKTPQFWAKQPESD